VTKTVGNFGTLDILVNNAGVLAINSIENFSLEDFDKMIAVNIRGLFIATQKAARHMRDGGRVHKSAGSGPGATWHYGQ
jgi:3-oxoacyl-[acyl-carrier protein] reductase